jgi:hypothetical protein
MKKTVSSGPDDFGIGFQALVCASFPSGVIASAARGGNEEEAQKNAEEKFTQTIKEAVAIYETIKQTEAGA